MLEPRVFKRAMKRYANVAKTIELKPELQFVIENYNQHHQNYLAAVDPILKHYHQLRLDELENWVKDEAGYRGLHQAIDKLRSKTLSFGPEKNLVELQNLLNYMGMLAEDKKVKASETFYAMSVVAEMIMLDGKQKLVIADFKSIYIDGGCGETLNLPPLGEINKNTFPVIYNRLAEMALGKRGDLYNLIESKWGKDFFNEKSPSPSRRSYSISSITLELLPEWLSTSPGSRRSSRATSTSTVTNSSSSTTISNSSSLSSIQLT